MNGRFKLRLYATRVWLFLLIAAIVTALYFLVSAPTSEAQTAVPTPDRLAAPPTVPSPTQADEGAQLYWLNCQPCHGDKGQGLTDAPDDEWRAQYPPEDQYCWNSGCHGARPYEAGFTLPNKVPAIIGKDSLNRFATLEDMHLFMKAAMPFQVPGGLSDEEYLQITAFIARENGIETGERLAIEDLATIPLAAAYNEVLTTAVPTPHLELSADDREAENSTLFPIRLLLLGGGLGIIMVFVFGGLIWLRHRR